MHGKGAFGWLYSWWHSRLHWHLNEHTHIKLAYLNVLYC